MLIMAVSRVRPGSRHFSEKSRHPGPFSRLAGGVSSGLWRRHSGDECHHERLPGGEHETVGEHAEALEQAYPESEFVSDFFQQVGGQFPRAAHGKGQQVEYGAHAGEGFRAVAEIVLDVIAIIFRVSKVSFSIFQRVPPLAASSATFLALTARLEATLFV